MKALLTLSSLFLMGSIGGTSANAATSLLPGLTYFEGREPLKGKLVFLFRTNAEHFVPWRHPPKSTTGDTIAAIYELLLPKGSLRKLTDCPPGTLFVSADADTFCVVAARTDGFHHQPTNVSAFVYSGRARRKRTVNLKQLPKRTCVAHGHVLFELETCNFSEETVTTAILDCDIATGETRTVAFPGASRWQYQHYGNIHVPRDEGNCVHFEYRTHGKRLAAGTDYPNGVYSLCLETRAIRWFAKSTEDNDDPAYYPRAFDGRYIFFGERQGPRGAFKLVSSWMDPIEATIYDPTGKQSRVLRTFSRSIASKGGTYVLSGLSPCRRYALVRFMEVEPSDLRWLNIYYLVDLSSGRTRILAKDEVERKTSGSMSPLHWVGGPTEEP